VIHKLSIDFSKSFKTELNVYFACVYAFLVTMTSEEQQEELEVIQAIFMDDYQDHTKVFIMLNNFSSIYTNQFYLNIGFLLFVNHVFNCTLFYR